MNHSKIIAEIGINHNGNIDLAKDMIVKAKECGCHYVKIQKRNPDDCVPEHQKEVLKDTPWGKMTYLEYKKKIEFSIEQVQELEEFSRKNGIKFFASVWDLKSVDVMKEINNELVKIPSALITDLELCAYARKKFKKLIISTGMSTEEEIKNCVKCCNPDVIMHTNSTYPCPIEDLNLQYILHLKKEYPNKEIGYSGHELETLTSVATILYGVSWIEKHFTIDQTLWGSDQKSSLNPEQMKRCCDDVLILEMATQYTPQDRILFPKENIKKQSLRK